MDLPDLWHMFGTGTDKQRLAKGVTVPGFGRQYWYGHQGRGVRLIWPQFSGGNNYLATVEPGARGEIRATYYPGYPKGTRKNKRPEPRVRNFPETNDRTLVRSIRKWVQRQIDMDPVAQALKLRDAWDLPQSPCRNGLTLVHSPSGVKLYEDCPHKYMRIRVTKDVKDEIGPAGVIGKRIHEVLRLVVEGGECEADLHVGEWDVAEVVKMLERAGKIVEKMKQVGEVQAELQVGLDRNLETTDFSSPQVWMRGVIDMLVLGKSEARIIDWKTGRRRFDIFQTSFYSMAVFARFPDVQRITFTYEWLKTGKRDRLDYTRDDMVELGRMLIGATRPIEQDAIWKKDPGPLCQWCPVRDCQHNEHKGRGKSPSPGARVQAGPSKTSDSGTWLVPGWILGSCTFVILLLAMSHCAG